MITFLILMAVAGAVVYDSGPIGYFLRLALGLIAAVVVLAIVSSSSLVW